MYTITTNLTELIAIQLLYTVIESELYMDMRQSIDQVMFTILLRMMAIMAVGEISPPQIIIEPTMDQEVMREAMRQVMAQTTAIGIDIGQKTHHREIEKT